MSQRVSFYVSKYIEGDPTIKVGLQRGLITSRILTKHIIEEEKEFRGSFDDVRNAVRKYADENAPLFNLNNAYKAFKDAYIDVRSRLACVEVERIAEQKEFLELISKFMGNEKFARVSNNAKSFILIISEEDAASLIKLIGQQRILSITKDISSINIHLDPSVKHTPGIYFLIMGQISLNQINIYDVYSYESELSVYVDQKDCVKVHEILYDLIEYEKKFLNHEKGKLSPSLNE